MSESKMEQLGEAMAMVLAAVPALIKVKHAAQASGPCTLEPGEVKAVLYFLNTLKGEMKPLRDEVARLEVERDRLREHSVMLNSISWKVGLALGTVTGEQVFAPAGDVAGEVDKLIEGYLKNLPAEFVPIEVDATLVAAYMRDSVELTRQMEG